MEVWEAIDEREELGDGILNRRTHEFEGSEAKGQNVVGGIFFKSSEIHSVH